MKCPSKLSRTIGPKRKPYLYPAILAILLYLLASCVITPAQTKSDVLARYHKPVHIEELDWLIVQANVLLLRQSIDAPDDAQLSYVKTPTLFFNAQTNRIEALAEVKWDELAALTSNDIRTALMQVVSRTSSSAELVIPELNKSDFFSHGFYMRFYGRSFKEQMDAIMRGSKTLQPWTTFAEYKDGELLIR
jgi:hypothetical protein